jgi:hypothetical protein
MKRVSGACPYRPRGPLSITGRVTKRATRVVLAGTAATFAAALAGAPAVAADDLPFSRGTWTLEATGSYIDPIRFSDAEFGVGTIAAGYYFADAVAITAELNGYGVHQFGEDSAGGGFGMGFRWHFARVDRLTLFADAVGGVNQFTVRTPPFGTHFNYTGKLGGGVTVRLADDFHLVGGARYFHLSNGNLHGRDENPSYDGVQFYGGLMWAF